MHDRLLEALLRIPLLREIRLVAAIRDPGLGFPSATDLRVFIPDMHLSSARTAARYHYQFNNEKLFIQLMSALTALRTGRQAGETVEVYHIGDYLDLWRESLAPPDDERVALDIKADHADLVDALESTALNASFLLGNHDFDLWQWHDYQAWDRRYYLPGSADPAILVMHGDYFDWVEKLPEFVKEIGVHFFARLIKPPKEVLGKMMDQAHLLNSPPRDFNRGLQLREPAALGSSQDVHSTVPPAYNLQTIQPGQPNPLYLESASAECAKVNTQLGAGIKVVVIGHTHRARIAAIHDAQGKLQFTLIDTGAWIEDCCEVPGGPAMRNAQITALSANEARIYQLLSDEA